MHCSTRTPAPAALTRKHVLWGSAAYRTGATRNVSEAMLMCKCMQAGNAEDVAKYAKRTVRVTQQHNDECKRLLDLMGVPIINVSLPLQPFCTAVCAPEVPACLVVLAASWYGSCISVWLAVYQLSNMLCRLHRKQSPSVLLCANRVWYGRLNPAFTPPPFPCCLSFLQIYP